VRGRAADQRQVHGRWVMPVDVQEALCDHPDVRYAVAIPADGGFCAVVVLAPGATVDEHDLTAFVAVHHGEHLTPNQIIAVDRVPVTEQGKPNRARIAAMMGERAEVPAR
jgi:fatty-acyl-CoA synthase